MSRRAAAGPSGSALVAPACGGAGAPLEHQPLPLELDSLARPAGAPWELELGFGKGRYLLARARVEPECRFLGVEVAALYFRRCAERARRLALENLVLLRGEALYLLAVLLPRGFARAVHVYFPDPWPKSRHHKRRLFDRDTVDLVLGALAPGGRLLFATDHLPYGEAVASLLAENPALECAALERWPGGARTNYEAKYAREGRPVVRLVATRRGAAPNVVSRDVLVGPQERSSAATTSASSAGSQ